ncbi:uncharacterized protein UDID_06680 [Ustilago sp. UG-2017a]|nr:uncharacterized protein UDID_06680 [Ustilago sp. UG-2017a]
MNAFPSELLHHHFACMVVAGLTSPSPKPNPPPTPASDGASTSTSEAAPPGHPTVMFPDLTKSLHDILAWRGRNTLWHPARGRAAVFHTVFAGHSIRLPPLKTKPSARHVPPLPSITSGSTSTPSEASIAAFSSLPPRSPLSPLHPNSPQFPDGLIAPVWVRKHRELIPSVFVSFHTLPSASDPDGLKTADEGLVKTISERRRTLAERGIKLTVVLLTEREMLDDPQLEARLSFIRRSSGLDSRASLFVLTPVSRAELGEFVASLHSALLEHAADFYREHARRVKRKRTRYPPPPSTLQPIANAISTLPTPSTSTKPIGVNDIPWLSREGWILRSEYKLAVFAELSSDIQEALVRYRGAYDLLCTSPTALLGSTLMLPPRTKRWAEAKVLADTLAIRICKLLLYSDDGEGAAIFFRRHLARFTELSTGWGIGTSTFEYWSWLSKQYRLFGELIEHATRSVQGAPLPPFQLPQHAPPLPSRLLHPDAVGKVGGGGEGMLLPNSNAVAVSICPYSTLQTAGAYYLLAALCTVERRIRFLRASTIPSSNQEEENTPLAHEKKVDHTAQLTESLTKSYDAFKRARLHRSALFVASRIATAYHDGGQHRMALKFLERILKSYAREEVGEVKAGLVEVAVEAAVAEADGRMATKMLMEVVDERLPMDEPRREGLVRAIKSFLQQQSRNQEGGEENGEEKEGGVGVVSAGFVGVETVWPVSEVEVGAEVPFQIVLRNGSGFDLTDVLEVEKMSVEIENGEQTNTVQVTASNSSSADAAPVIIDLGKITSKTATQIADLTRILTHNGTLAIQATLPATSEGFIRITSINLHVRTTTTNKLALTLDLALPTATDDDPTQPRWLLPSGRRITLAQRPDPCSTRVKPRSFNVSLTATAPFEAGYVDEAIPISISLLNNEKEAVLCWIDAILQPSYDGAHDTLSPSKHEDSGPGQKVERLSTGKIEAGGKSENVIWLRPRQGAGLRTVDVSVGVRVARDERDGEGERVAVSASTSMVLPIAALVDAKAWTKITDAKREGAVGKREKALLDFDSDSSDEDEASEKAEVRTGLEVAMIGQVPVHISTVELVSAKNVIPSSFDIAAAEEAALGEWILDDRFSFFRILPSTTPNLSWRITWTRTPTWEPNTTLIPVPLPTQPSSSASPQNITPGLTLSLNHSPTSRLHYPFNLSLTLTNHDRTRSYKLVLTLDSDPNFTIAGIRRLSIPYLLPGQTRRWEDLARFVPQCVGELKLPKLGVRVLDAQAGIGEERATLAVIHSHDERGADDGGWSDVVKFRWESAGGGKVLVRI